MDGLKIGCVVMAAGCATRFGGRKLSAEIDGRSLFCRALDAVPSEAFSKVVVVVQEKALCPAAEVCGFVPLVNPHPEWGASHTIALGLTALGDVDAALFQVADQPFLRRRSIEALVALYRAHPEDIAALGHGGVRGNPCLFPKKFFPELLALTDDHGGSAVIRRHEDALRLLETAASELTDVDTRQTLEELKKE